jgi:hypothetical protein
VASVNIGEIAKQDYHMGGIVAGMANGRSVGVGCRKTTIIGVRGRGGAFRHPAQADQ